MICWYAESNDNKSQNTEQQTTKNVRENTVDIVHQLYSGKLKRRKNKRRFLPV